MAEKITIRVSFDQTAISMGIIGRVGENISRQILFDCTSAMSGRTSASIICVAKRPGDSEPYPVSLTRVGSTNVYRLVLSSTEVAVAGTVQFELRMLDGSEILKAAICTGTVENSLTGIADTPGSPIPDALNRFDAALEKLESMDVEAAVNAAYEAAEAANAVAAYPVGMMGGEYTISVGETAVTIDATSGFTRVLSNGKYLTVSTGIHTLTQCEGYGHGVIVLKDGEFSVRPPSLYNADADTSAVAVGVVYWDGDGKIKKYQINGQVKDTVTDAEASQLGVIGGNYGITVGNESVVIDATGGLMRVLVGTAWKTVTAGTYTLAKPESYNHAVISYKDGGFSVKSPSVYAGSKTADEVAVGIVYWDDSGKILKYEINGNVADTRSPNYGGKIIRDVHQFGAMGDGVTDDTDALQAALDACTNGILYLPNGTYLFRKTLKIHSNTHIMGNKGYTKLKLKPQAANELDMVEWRPALGRNKYPAVRTDDNSSGCIIEGIVFEGDTTYFHDLRQNGLYVTGSHHVIQDCQFVQWNYFPDEWENRQENASAWGLAVCNTAHIKVEDCYFAQNGYEGMGIETSYQVDIRGCYFGKAMRTALQFHKGSARVSLEGCVLNNNVDSDNPLGDFATMTFHGAEDAPIDGVKIVNCDFRHKHIQCVAGYEHNVQISNCRIYSDSNRFVVITMGAEGVIPQDKGWQIVGNEFYSTANGGDTAIEAAVDGSVIADNVLHTNATAPIVMTGANNMAADNLIIRITSSGTPESFVYPPQSSSGGAVTSVNGKTGAVQLNASDVHALPDTTVIPEAYTLPTASATVKGGVKVGSGLQMVGDALQVEPEPTLGRLETITIDEESAGTLEIIRTHTGLKQIRINFTAPEQASAQNVFITYYMGDKALTSGGRAYYGNNSTSASIFKMRQVGGYWDCETEIGGSGTAAAKYGQVNTGMVEVETHPAITKIRIYTFSPGFGVGTKFEIYGGM